MEKKITYKEKFKDKGVPEQNYNIEEATNKRHTGEGNNSLITAWNVRKVPECRPNRPWARHVSHQQPPESS